MARFGLSPFGNPIDAGVDTYAKLNNVFNQNDRLEMEKQDNEQRRQLTGMQIQEAKKKQQWEDEDRPHQVLQHKYEDLETEHKLLHGPIVSAMTKNYQAMQNKTQPEYSADEIDAILKLQKDAPLLSDDPHEATQQVSALHNLQQTMGQITPALMQHAQQLPEGQRKIRIGDQNAPGLVDSFNTAFSKLLNGKQASGFLLDMDKGAVIPIVKGEGGQDAPLTKGDEIHQIPLSILQQYVSKGAAFGNLLLPALAQVDGNDKLMEEVKKSGEQREFATAKAKAIEQIPEDTDPKESRKQYTKLMGEKGYSVTPAEVKELFPDRKPRNLLKIEEGDPSKPGFKRDVLVDQDTGERVFSGQGRQEFKPPNPSSEDEKERHREKRTDQKEIDKAASTHKSIRDKVNKLRQKMDAMPAGLDKEALQSELQSLYQEDDDARKNYEGAMQKYIDTYGQEYTGGGIVDRGGSKRRGLTAIEKKNSSSTPRASGIDLSQFDR